MIITNQQVKTNIFHAVPWKCKNISTQKLKDFQEIAFTFKLIKR